MRAQNMKTPQKMEVSGMPSKNRASMRQYSAYKTEGKRMESGSLQNSQTMQFGEDGKPFPTFDKITKKAYSLKKGSGPGLNEFETSEPEDLENYSRWVEVKLFSNRVSSPNTSFIIK